MNAYALAQVLDPGYSPHHPKRTGPALVSFVLSGLAHVWLLSLLIAAWVKPLHLPNAPISIEFIAQTLQHESLPVDPDKAQALAENDLRASSEKLGKQEEKHTTDVPFLPAQNLINPGPQVDAPRLDQAPTPAERQISPMTAARSAILVTPQAEAEPRQVAAHEPQDAPRPLINFSLKLTPSLGEMAELDTKKRDQELRTLNPADEATVDISTRSHPHAQYFHGLSRTVESNWVDPRRRNGQKWVGKVVLRFTIDREGQLLGIEVLNAAKNEPLNQAAIDAVKRAAPFPSIPQDWKIKRLNVVTTFEYSRRKR